jgi:hypothetical protein
LNFKKLSLTIQQKSVALCASTTTLLVARMTATGAQKCSAAERIDPLNEAGILQRVLSYVPGQWLFLAAVSSLWRSVYSRLTARTMQQRTFSYRGITTADFTCVPQMTLYSTVFASPSRVQFTHESGVNCSTTSYQLAAGMHATVATLVAARELGMHFTVYTMRGAADGNELSVLQFLHARGCPRDCTVTAAAAKKGHFEMLRWLRESGFAWDPREIMREVASSGNIEMAAWVKQQPRQQRRVKCDTRAMNAAAEAGHTAMCAYLHAERCRWDESACIYATEQGHVETLRWLHEHGCPCTRTTCIAAAESGSVDVMMYLQQQDLMNTPAVLTDMLNAAGGYNKLAAAQWLRQLGAEWPAVFRYSFMSWSGETLAWARAQGCTSPTQ